MYVGKAGFKGTLGVRIIRANPTRWQRLKDSIKEFFLRNVL